ncbi:MAG: Fe-S-cluster containining protein [Myxococcota bacterium]|jgi:Fe-S-cluster containining protein
MRFRRPEGLRWACHGCARCCSSGYELGPVDEGTIEGLRAADIGAQWAPARDGWMDTRHTPEGPRHVLRQRDGRCIFLRDDDLCAIHALLGPDAKPGFCREFPYHFVEDAAGTVAVVRPTCGGFHKTFSDAAVVGPELERIASLPRVMPIRRWAPDAVVVLPGTAIGADAWLSIEPRLLDHLAASPRQPDAGVAFVRETLVAVTGATPVQAQPAIHRRALGALLQALDSVLSQVTAGGGGQAHQRRFAAESHARVRAARANLDTPPPLSPDAVVYTGLLLRSFLLAKEFQAWGGVPEGLGVFLLGVAIARRAGGPELDDLGPHLAEWTAFRDNAMVTGLLRRAAPATRDLFLHASAAPAR